MRQHKKPLEATHGYFSALPHALLDSVAFMGAGHPARSLLFDLIRQHNGRNNGHIQMAVPWMKTRGWTSNDVLHRAKLELIERGLIIQTRQGGLNMGANLYAVTWLAISNFAGLDIQAKDYHPGKWRFMDTLPVMGQRMPGLALQSHENHNMSSASRCAIAPPDGVANPLAAPPHGANPALSGIITAPSNGNNEYYHLPAERIFSKHRLVVGKKDAAVSDAKTIVKR